MMGFVSWRERERERVLWLIQRSAVVMNLLTDVSVLENLGNVVITYFTYPNRAIKQYFLPIHALML